MNVTESPFVTFANVRKHWYDNVCHVLIFAMTTIIFMQLINPTMPVCSPMPYAGPTV